MRGGRALQRMQGETGAARPARGVRVVEVLEGVKRHGSEKLDSKARPRVVCGEGVCAGPAGRDGRGEMCKVGWRCNMGAAKPAELPDVETNAC